MSRSLPSGLHNTRAIVGSDPDSSSANAAKARAYGIPIIAEGKDAVNAAFACYMSATSTPKTTLSTLNLVTITTSKSGELRSKRFPHAEAQEAYSGTCGDQTANRLPSLPKGPRTWMPKDIGNLVSALRARQSKL